MNRIVAIDFETANEFMASACSIGVTVFEDGIMIDCFGQLLKPHKDYREFNYFNMQIHHITSEMVQDEMEFDEFYPRLEKYLDDSTIICAHNARFDIQVLKSLCILYGLKYPKCCYFDTVELSRNVFSELKHHRLNDVCDYMGIVLDHHDATSDARGCALIVVNIMNLINEFDIENLLSKTNTKIRVIR